MPGGYSYGLDMVSSRLGPQNQNRADYGHPGPEPYKIELKSETVLLVYLGETVTGLSPGHNIRNRSL